MQDYKDRVYRFEASRKALSTKRAYRNKQSDLDFSEGFIQKAKLFCVAGCILFICYMYVRVQIKYEKESVIYEIAQIFKKRKGGNSVKQEVHSVVDEKVSGISQDFSKGQANVTREQKMFLTRLDGKQNKVVLVPVLQKVESKKEEFFRSLLQNLVSMKVAGLINAINPKVQILDARLENEVLIVDVNQQFEFNRYGVAGIRAQIQQILWTVFESSESRKENIQAISFTIEGKRKSTIGSDGMPLSPFYSSRHLRRSILARESQK